MQSALTMHPLVSAHLVVQEPPQSVSVSVPSFVPSKQALTHFMVVALQWPLVQSPSTMQPLLSPHFLFMPSQVAPPQSVSVSVPFCTPSVQLGVWQVLPPLGPEHTWLVQSPMSTHFLPSAQALQAPPQSLSVSVPSCVPSPQLD